MTSKSKDQQEITCFASATLLMAAAAFEALLAEAASIKDPKLYTKKYFNKGMPAKYEELMGRPLNVADKDADDLWKNRNALTHSEPNNDRSKSLGKKINSSGAIWAYEVVKKVSLDIWGDKMPSWFSKATGLTPKD